MTSINQIQESVAKLKSKLDLEALKDKASRLKSQTLEDGFWDHKNSGQIAQELGHIENTIQEFEDFESKVNEFLEFSDLIENYDQTEDGMNDLLNLEQINHKLVKAQTLSGEFDKLSTILSIHSGAGGDDAQDFANILLQMYISYAKNNGYSVELIDADYSTSGIKHASLKIKGTFAFGNLKAEHGVHRLVRLSPFNSGNTRETSFALVDAIPILESTETNFELNQEDLKIDTYKSSGPGGQSVNTTDSAVRVTHLPTGIQASCQSERSQHQNKANALEILKSKLIHIQKQQQAETLEDIRGEKSTNAFGSQIRSYTLHPYKLVKDHRTKFESTNPDNVFAGDLQDFIDSFLMQ